MKLSVALLATVAVADDKKVPPRHPLQRLNKLKHFGEEILDTWFEFMPRKDNWVRKFKANADRMKRNFQRGEQRCGHYDENQLPHGGPARKRREADDDVFRYDRTDPCKGIKQITTGYRKWAERYISQCGGQRNNKYIVNRMNKWNRVLAKQLNDSGRTCEVPVDPATPPQCASNYPLPAGYQWHQTRFGVIYTKLYDDFYTADEARALCTGDADFLHMPIPTSQGMNNWYFNFVGTRTDRDVWLGMSDSAQEGHFVDDFGNDLVYTNWFRGEPNDIGSGEDNVEMILSGLSYENSRWNDQYDQPSTQNRGNWNWRNNNMALCTVVIPCEDEPEPEPEPECPSDPYADYPLPEGYQQHDTEWGTIYTKVYDDFYQADEARDLCTGDADFLHLPIPTSQAMNQWYFNFIGTRSDRDMWLGMSDSAREGHFVDDFGNDLVYTNWYRNEPNDIGSGEDNVEMILSGRFYENSRWNDQYDQPSTQNRGNWNWQNNNLAVCTFIVPCTAP